MTRPLTSALTVFIASPGGVSDERDAAEAMARLAGDDYGIERGVSVVVRRWEQMIGDAGNAQSQINPSVDEADVFIGIIGRRWGTETGNGFDSGFGEEFERALDRWKSTGEPAIHLFFKTIDPEALRDPGEQLTKVLRFRQRIESEHRAFYNVFQGVDEFGHAVYRALGKRLVAMRVESFAPTESEVPDPGEDDELSGGNSPFSEAVGQTLRVFADVMTGGDLSQTLDFDRLELFALAVSRDDDAVPTHLANRMFLRHADLEPMWVETTALFQAFMRDRGVSQSETDWVIPFLSMPSTRAELLSVIERHAYDSVQTTDASLVRGWLRVAAKFGVRPARLWDVDYRSDDGADRFCKIWIESAKSPTRETAILYWLQVASEGDLDRARALTRSADLDLEQFGHVLVGMLRDQPDASALASVEPGLLVHPAVRRLFTGNDPFQTLDEAALLRAAQRSYGSLDLRIAALLELIRRDAVPATLIADAMKQGSRDSFDIDGWAARAQALLFDRPISDTFLTSFITATTSLGKEDRQVTRLPLARLLRHNPSLADLLESSTWAEDYSPEGVAFTLERHAGTPQARRLALSLIDHSNENVNEWVERLERAGMESSTSAYVRGQFQMHGLAYFARHSAAPVPATVVRQLRLLAHGQTVSRYDAAQLLVHFSSDSDVEFLLSRHADIDRADSMRAVAIIAKRATLKALRAIATGNHSLAAAEAILELRRRGRPLSRRALTSLLYSDHPRVRIAALSDLLDGSELSTAQALLVDYTSKRPTYFYNVVCGIDAYLAEQRS